MTHAEVDRIFNGAVLGAVQPRVQAAVSGKDRASFLQGFLTNDVEALQPGAGCYSAWLTPQGRMLTDMHVLASPSMMLLDLPQHTVQATLERLEQFHFAEDVTINSLGESLRGVWVHGPGAATVLAHAVNGVADLATWVDYQHSPVAFGDVPVVIARIDQLGVPGYCVYTPPSHEASLVDALVVEGAARVSPEAIDAARIEAGYPLFGVDMTEETIPLEAGIEDRAISTTKGCYVGQEVIIRVLHRGHGRVAKKLVRLEVQGAVEVGASLRSADRDAGRVTSAAAISQEQGVALGYVHRDFAQPGTELVAGTGVPVRVAVGPVLRK